MPAHPIRVNYMRGIGIPLLGGCIEWNVVLSEIHAKASFIWRRQAYPATGITNRVLDSNGETLGFVLFGDYDHTTLADVECSINSARKKIAFGPAHILRSNRDSFHVIIPTVHSYADAVYFTALTESGHDLSLFAKERELTLRTSPKGGLMVKYLKTLPIEYGYVLPATSFPHSEFMQAIHGVEPAKGTAFAGKGGELELKHYYYYNR